MSFFSCLLIFLLFLVLSVAYVLSESTNGMLEDSNGTVIQSLASMHETDTHTNGTNQNSTEKSVQLSQTDVPLSKYSVQNVSVEDAIFLENNENYTRSSKKIKFDLNTNRIVNSKRRNLLKHKIGTLKNANNLRQSFRRTYYYDQRAMSEKAVDRLKANIYNSLDLDISPKKFRSYRTPLIKVKNLNDLNSNLQGAIDYQIVNFDSGKNDNVSKNGDYATNCTEENRCQLSKTDENRRQDTNVFDTSSDLENEHKDDGSKNFTNIEKENGMEDKMFLSPNHHENSRTYDIAGKKKSAFKDISDKIKFVFPFLKGFGLNKEPKKPIQKFEYDPKLGVFYMSKNGPYILSPKSHLPIYPSSLTSGPKTPVLLSDLVQQSSKIKYKGIPVPYNVEVEKRIPYIIKVPYDNPVPVHIAAPYGVPVEKIVPYPVRVEVPEPYPVTKIVKKPYNLYVDNPVPVEVEQPYTILKEQVKPYEVETIVNKPYIDPVYNDFKVTLQYDKNIPYPVSGSNTHEHVISDGFQEGNPHPVGEKQVLSDTILSPSNNNINLIKPSEHDLLFSYTGGQTRPINIESHMNPMYNNKKSESFACFMNHVRLPKTRNPLMNMRPLYYSNTVKGKKSISNIRGSQKVTEAQFLDLKNPSQTFTRSQLHHQRMQALLKQNPMLKGNLKHTRVKLVPFHQPNREMLPEFKPLHTNLNLAVLQKDKYRINNYKNQGNPQDFLNFKANLQNMNIPNSNTGAPVLYHQNVLHAPETENEIIHDHLKQLYIENKNPQVEVIESESFSYKIPDPTSTTSSSYYNQGDSDAGFSIQQEVFNVSPNVSQDSELYRLQLEYKILDTLMKNIDKNKTVKSTSGYDESLVTKFNTDNIQVVHISSEAPFYINKNSINNSKTRGKSNFEKAISEENPHLLPKTNIQPATESNVNSGGPNSWVSHKDNYTIYLTNVIKDSIGYSKPSTSGEEETVLIGNVQKPSVVHTESSTVYSVYEPLHKNKVSEDIDSNGKSRHKPLMKNPESSTLFVTEPFRQNNFKDNGIIMQDFFKNDLSSTHKPLYNVDSKIKSSTEIGYGIDYEQFTGGNSPTVNQEKYENNNNNNNNNNAFEFNPGSRGTVFKDSIKTTTDNYNEWVGQTNLYPSKTINFPREVKNYRNYAGYYKKPINEVLVNNTDTYEGNSAINFGKLGDFLDIIQSFKPKNNHEKSIVKNVTNAIDNNVQEQLDISTDMNAENSYHIESKIQSPLTTRHTNDLDKTMVMNKNSTVLDLINYNRSVRNQKMEKHSQPKQSAPVSANFPDLARNESKVIQTIRKRDSTKLQNNEASSTFGTTITDYANIRKGKDIIDGSSGELNKTNINVDENMMKASDPGIDSKMNISQNKTLNSGVEVPKIVNETSDPNISAYGIKADYDISPEKNIFITSNNIGNIHPNDKSYFNDSYQNEKLSAKIHSTVEPVILINGNPETTSYLPTTTNTIGLPSTTTTISISVTADPSSPTSSQNNTKAKPARKRGSIRASSSLSGKPGEMNVDMKKNASEIKTSYEFVPNLKRRRQYDKPSSFNNNDELRAKTSTHFWKNDTLVDILERKGDILNNDEMRNTKSSSNHTNSGKNKDISSIFDDSVDEVVTHKTYQKDSDDFRIFKILPFKENKEITTTQTPSTDRVTVETIKKIERIKIKNRFKEKIENTSKKPATNVSKVGSLYNYKNNASLLERRQKNRERFMSSFMTSTQDSLTTEAIV